MCSILYRLNQFKIHLPKPHSTNLTATTSKNSAATNADGMDEWCAVFTLFARLSAYIAILALMVLVIFLIIKYLTDLDYESNSDEVTTTTSETTFLQLRKAISFNYGTCGKDLESGYYSTNSNGDGSSSSSSNNSSAELYDGKVCVICYDEERNCFFVPCGHCATCYNCAQRIFNGENKVCPVCRRFIGKENLKYLMQLELEKYHPSNY